MAPCPPEEHPDERFRISDDLWLPFVGVCKKQGQTPSEVIRDGIRAYLENHKGEANTSGEER